MPKEFLGRGKRHLILVRRVFPPEVILLQIIGLPYFQNFLLPVKLYCFVDIDVERILVLSVVHGPEKELPWLQFVFNDKSLESFPVV